MLVLDCLVLILNLLRLVLEMSNQILNMLKVLNLLSVCFRTFRSLICTFQPRSCLIRSQKSWSGVYRYWFWTIQVFCVEF